MHFTYIRAVVKTRTSQNINKRTERNEIFSINIISARMKLITLRIKYNQICNYEQDCIGKGNVKTRHSPKQHKELFPHLKVLTITRNICNMQNKMSIIILMFS